MELRVTLNGTDKNPWHRMGLKQNPFPQLGKAEYDAACLRLAALGGDPIPNVQHIKDWLKGYFSDEFIKLCCKNFKPGEIVRFTVHWKD